MANFCPAWHFADQPEARVGPLLFFFFCMWLWRRKPLPHRVGDCDRATVTSEQACALAKGRGKRAGAEGRWWSTGRRGTSQNGSLRVESGLGIDHSCTHEREGFYMMTDVFLVDTYDSDGFVLSYLHLNNPSLFVSFKVYMHPLLNALLECFCSSV